MYSNNYDIDFGLKLDRNLKKLSMALASDARNMVREEILKIENDVLDFEAYWYTPNHEACAECEARDGVRLKDIKNLGIHPNCKCTIILMQK